jgi:hypothetical protein
MAVNHRDFTEANFFVTEGWWAASTLVDARARIHDARQ